MSHENLLRIEGEVDTPLNLTVAELENLDAACQIPDVSQIDPKRRGRAVTLRGLLATVQPKPTGDYLTLHASADDFHASVPLAAVIDQGVLIYSVDGQPLPASAGGPFRFLIRDTAACHTDEVDECASVKFVDRIEITRGKGFDNRPEDDDAHEALHRKDAQS